MTEQNELSLAVDAVRRRKEGAEAVLFKLYYNELYEYILSRVKQTAIAKTVTQDTFIEIFDTIGSLTDEADFVRWSRQIAYRRCISVIESQLNQLSEASGEDHAQTSSKWRKVKSFIWKIIVGIVITVLISGVREVFVDLRNTQNSVGGDETQNSGEERTLEESQCDTSETERIEGASTVEDVSETETQEIEQTEQDSTEIQESELESTEKETSEAETTEPYVYETEATEPEPVWVGKFQLIKRGKYYEVIGVVDDREKGNFQIPAEYEGVPIMAIGEGVFQGMYVNMLNIPKSITKIAETAFRRCHGPRLFYVEEGNLVYHSVDGECLLETATRIVIIGRKPLPEANIKHIGAYAFSGYVLSADLVIPEGIISIGKHAFEYANNLQRVWFPSTLTSIESAIFKGTRKLTEFYYVGTMEQWNAIKKARDWDNNMVGYVIHCTDGDIWK